MTQIHFPYDFWTLNCLGLQKLFVTPLSHNKTIKWSTHLYKTYHMGFYTKCTFQGKAVSGKSDGVWNWHHTALAAVYMLFIY